MGKVSENRFARADLEHIHLLIDDDMRMEALRQTNYVKSLVTAQGRMDLEKKGRQSYQGWMFARLLAFSNGDLQSLYDRSNGFYRRQLILTTKERPPDRVEDPDIAEKMHPPPINPLLEESWLCSKERLNRTPPLSGASAFLPK